MVIAILEPVFAGILVSLINKYLISGNCTAWLRQSCSAEEVREAEDEKEEEEREEHSSTNTTISDADVHVHCH